MPITENTTIDRRPPEEEYVDLNEVVKEPHIEQKPSGGVGTMCFLGLLAACIPLSTDMYLPALPVMARNLHASTQIISLTLTLFFACFSITSLLWGPLSDKYGRKSTLYTGLSIFAVSTILCSFCANAQQLIICRVLQAVGGASTPAISTALAKDMFHGRKREKCLVIIQSMLLVGPMVAPVFGALILKFTSWRGIFWVVSMLGVAAIVWSSFIREPAIVRHKGSIFTTFCQLGIVLKNPGFTSLLVPFSLVLMPMFAYISASSFIYIKEFRVSEFGYSYFFTLNAICQVLGPILFLHLSRHMHNKAIINVCFGLMTVSGLSICLLGHLCPWAFLLSIIPASFASGIIRPPSTNLMLEQEHNAVGSASSLINFALGMAGSIGMLIVSCCQRSLIMPLGIVHLGAGLICGGCWLYVSDKPFIRHTPHTHKAASGIDEFGNN
ncbi:multidrug effflux MFS transporter [bacterium]|nr:multidrug effflux MFS transporter [bacterium]